LRQLPTNSDELRTTLLPCVRGNQPISTRPDFASSVRRPWWLWWNILSIDAPSVAIVWALLFARMIRSNIPFLDFCILAITVWLVYIADRLLDGRVSTQPSTLHERHYFCRRHRRLLVTLMICAAALNLWLVQQDGFRSGLIRSGWILFALVVLYMFSAHTQLSSLSRWLPKEILVGFLFAAGVSLPAWSRSRSLSYLIILPCALFGLLCSLNCVAIEYWENGTNPRIRRGLLAPWSEVHIDSLAGSLIALGFVGPILLGTPPRPASGWFAISCGALLILVLNHLKARIAVDAIRVLADAALVLPALIFLFVRF
jgi:hypothetical protein